MLRMNRTATYFCAALSLLVIAGCKHGPATVLKKAPYEAPSNYTRTDNTAQGIAIGMPPGWTSIGDLLKEAEAKQKQASTPAPNLGSPPPGSPGSENAELAKQLDALTSQMGRNNVEEIRQFIKEKEAIGVYIYCFNPGVKSVAGEDETHYSVEKQTVGGNAQLEDVIAKINDDLKGEDPPQMIDLPIGKVARIHAHVKLSDGGEVTRVYYGIVNGSDYYIVRFVTEEQGLDIDNIANEVIKTFRVTK